MIRTYTVELTPDEIEWLFKAITCYKLEFWPPGRELDVIEEKLTSARGFCWLDDKSIT